MAHTIETLLDDIIRNKALSVLFQPIYCTTTSTLYGYEALIRGPSDTPLHAPIPLFEAALQHDRLSELELLSRATSIECFSQLNLPGKLFLNISPMVFLNQDHPKGMTLRFLEDSHLSPERIVIELSEKYPIEQTETLVRALTHYRALGLKVAVDDLGSGYAGLKLWSEMMPDYVKIDRYFINELHLDPTKRAFVRSILHLGHQINACVIAEGVETEDEFMELQDLGMTHAQGFLLGRPSQLPTVSTSDILIRNQRNLRHPRYMEKTASSLIKQSRILSINDRAGEIVDYLISHPLVQCLPVVEKGRPVGIIRRNLMLEEFSRPYGRALLEKKPIKDVMSIEMGVVEADTQLEQVARQVTENEETNLMTHFIVVDKGYYIGIASTRDLIRQLTQQQVQSASYANPLTLLPGNVPIYQTIDALLQSRSYFSIAYLDINAFKPYNDVYGYSRGDQVIRHVSSLLQKHCNQDVFIGHIGGDDFVAIFTDNSWFVSCKKILNEFTRTTPRFYNQDDYRNGYVVSVARNGETQQQPLLGLAIGVVRPDPERCHSHHDVAELASKAKKQAKQQNASCIFVDRREGPSECAYRINESPHEHNLQQ